MMAVLMILGILLVVAYLYGLFAVFGLGEACKWCYSDWTFLYIALSWLGYWLLKRQALRLKAASQQQTV